MQVSVIITSGRRKEAGTRMSRRLSPLIGVLKGAMIKAESQWDKSEFEVALCMMKKAGAEGPDGIAPLFLQNLGDAGKDWLLDCCNRSWRSGVSPQSWRDATIVPVPKPGKAPGKIDSNRPIALTSVIAKLMERMVANRLQHVAEAAGLWSPDQAGFRAQRSSMDQVLRLTQGVDDGFQRSKPADRTVLALLDFSKAYDRVWRADLLDCMLKQMLRALYGQQYPLPHLLERAD